LDSRGEPRLNNVGVDVGGGDVQLRGGKRFFLGHTGGEGRAFTALLRHHRGGRRQQCTRIVRPLNRDRDAEADSRRCLISLAPRRLNSDKSELVELNTDAIFLSTRVTSLSKLSVGLTQWSITLAVI
jgi:hypothetical protein